MNAKESYYSVLGVTEDSNPEEIRSAFRQMVLTKHPDHGGDAQEFISVQTAYEVLIDSRKRRIYDRYGAEGLDKPSETLLTQEFRGGSFAADPDDSPRNLEQEVDALRRQNESLQRQLMIVKPDSENAFASSFESWLRNRDPNEPTVVTSENLLEHLGVAEGSYDPVPIPDLESLTFQYARTGSLSESVESTTESLPSELHWNEVLVRMLAAPITPVDHHLARWAFIPGEDAPTHPFPVGSEGVGMVVGIGPGVEDLQPHDLVIPAVPNAGSWREIGIFKKKDLFRFGPTSLTPERIANFYAYAHAYRLLEDFGSLLPGDTIVQSQAEGPIGQAIVQLCRMLQIKTINLVDPHDDFEEIADLLHSQGATHVWKNEGDIRTRIERSRVPLPRLGIDTLGGSTFSRIGTCLRPDSTLVTYGSRSGRLDPFPYAELLYHNIEIRGFWLYKWLRESEKGIEQLVAQLLPLMEEGNLEVATSPWGQLPQSWPAMLADPKPNVLLELGTVEEANELAEKVGRPETQLDPPG